MVSACNVPCWHPIKAYRSAERSASGGYGITFNPHKALIEGSSFMLPCGRCGGCRLDRADQWATRCVHEAQLYGARNSFITLTFSNEHCPTNYSVDVRDLQLFMKRLRKSLPSQLIRFFACGEYGEQNLRPHYHALIFNYDFHDKKFYTRRKDYDIYRSEKLSELWPFGLHEIGALTHKSAAYCARYSMKKINGDDADEHYFRQSPIDGNWYRVEPEFLVMSRRPGIGKGWLDKYKSDAFPSDYVIVDGKRKKPPRFYSEQLSEEEKLPIQRARKRHALTQRENNTKDRLAVREEVQRLKLQRLKREL